MHQTPPDMHQAWPDMLWFCFFGMDGRAGIEGTLRGLADLETIVAYFSSFSENLQRYIFV